MTRLAEILRAVDRKDVDLLGKLTPEYANLKDQDGLTILMNAILAEDCDPSITALLIDHGADVDATEDGQHWTALHFAVSNRKETIVTLLLRAGAAVDPIDVYGDTPLWRSVMNNPSSLRIIKDLLAHGADPTRKNSHGISPIDLARTTSQTDILALFERQD